MADNVKSTSGKKDKKEKKKKDSKPEKDSGIPSTSNEVKDNKKKKKEKDKKSDSEEIPNASTSSEIPESKKKKDKKAKKGSKKEGDEIPSASALAGEMEVSSKDNKKNKKDKSKKNDKKNPKENSGNQADTEAENVPQFYSPAGVDYSGMQMDDFQENPSCFSKFSNPLKKKHGYDFETTLESTSINYQEVPVSIERAPVNRQSVMKVTVTPKQDGSLPPVKQGPPLNQLEEVGFPTYPDNGTVGQPMAEARKDEVSTSSRNEVKKLEEKISELEKTNKQHQVSLEEYKLQVTKAFRDKDEVVQRLTDENCQKQCMDTEFEKLQSKYRDLEVEYTQKVDNLQKERERLAQRLAKEWSDKIASDESSVENVSIRNRPMVVAEAYEQLFSQEWLEVKNMLDDETELQEEQKIAFLCDLIVAALTIAKNKFNERLKEMEMNLHNPLRYSTPEEKKPDTSAKGSKRMSSIADESEYSSTESNPPKHEKSDSSDFVMLGESVSPSEISMVTHVSQTETHIMNEIGDFYRKTADTVDLKAILHDIHSYVSQRKVKGDQWLNDVEKQASFKNYMNACSRQAWKMALQRPSMTCSMSGVGEKWDDKTQDVSFISDDPSHDLARVTLYQYPALYHDTRLMVKGKVIVKLQPATSSNSIEELIGWNES